MKRAAAKETNPEAKTFLETMLKNVELAGQMDKPVCQSPGFPSVWIRWGEAMQPNLTNLMGNIIMGSGNAAFFSFAPLLPNVAHVIGVPIIQLIFPLQVLLGFGRASSPITGAIVAISGLAGVSPFQVAKRTFIPMLFGTAITYIAYFLFWY